MLKGKKLHPFVTYADRMERASERHSVGGRVVWARWHFAGLILLHCIRRRRCGGAHEEDAKSFQLDYLFLFFFCFCYCWLNQLLHVLSQKPKVKEKKNSLEYAGSWRINVIVSMCGCVCGICAYTKCRCVVEHINSEKSYIFAALYLVPIGKREMNFWWDTSYGVQARNVIIRFSALHLVWGRNSH